MSDFWLYFLFFAAMFVIFIVRQGQASPEEKRQAAAENRPAQSRSQIELNAKAEREARIICQHCGVAGHVTTRMYQKKGNISGGKATGALLTGGVSLLATGLARKGWVTQLSCANCGMKWEVVA